MTSAARVTPGAIVRVYSFLRDLAVAVSRAPHDSASITTVERSGKLWSTDRPMESDNLSVAIEPEEVT